MNRVRVGVTEAAREKIVQGAGALGALLIVVSLFLPWYSVGLSDTVKDLAEAGVQEEIESAEEIDVDAETATELINTSVDYSGWSSLEMADAFLLFVALAAALLVLRRRGAGAGPARREGDDTLLLLGLLAVITVLVLLVTKNTSLGMLSSTIDFAQDKAEEFGVPGAQMDVLSISPDIGLWLGLLGALLTLAAGFFHSLVDAAGSAPGTAEAPTTAQPGTGSAPASPAGPSAPGTGPEPPTAQQPGPPDPGGPPPGTR